MISLYNQSKVQEIYNIKKLKIRTMQNSTNFNQIGQYTNQTLQNHQNFNQQFKEERIILTDIQSDQFDFEPFYQKSAQNIATDYEISFEKLFMTQHSSVFKKQLSNYMEFVRTYCEYKDQELNTKITYRELINVQPIQMRLPFYERLQHYEKLQEFLDVVANFTPSQIAIELLQISQQTLLHFQASHLRSHKHCSSKELLSLVPEIVSNLKDIHLMSMQTHLKESDRIILSQKYQRFIEIYCSTTILVIGQFFQNPFHQVISNSLKRPLKFFSDDEDEESEPIPQKKRKIFF